MVYLLSIVVWFRRDAGERYEMAISYNGLWKLLIDKNMKKTDLMDQIGISSGTLAKMGRNEEVALSVLTKICEKYECDYGDLISYVNDKETKRE